MFNFEKGYDVFLGGTHASSWRQSFLKLINAKCKDLKCYDPVTENWTYENVILENLVKQHAKHHVYVLSPNMIGLYSIAEMVDSVHDRNKETYFYIMPNDLSKDGENTNWSPRVSNSLHAVSNMLLKHGAHKAESLEDLVDCICKSVSDLSGDKK